MKLIIEKMFPDVNIPKYQRDGDAGMDVESYFHENQEIPWLVRPGETVKIPTGIKLGIPRGYYVMAVPRSGISLKTPIRLSNSPGTVDAGYKDEFNIIVTNSSTTEVITIPHQMRLAQLIVMPVIPVFVFEGLVADTNDSPEDRGGGFNSTGSDIDVIGSTPTRG